MHDRQPPVRQLARYASTRLGYEPQGNPVELSKDLREGETRVCIVGTDVDDADEVYNLRPLALTDSKRGEERSKVLEGSERPPEEERKSAYKRTFQPLGRSVSEDRTHLGISNSKEAATGSILIDQPELWKKTVAEKTGTYLSDARKEIIDKTRPNTNEMIEFRPGRDPKEALEGDLIRFLHRNHDNNSISWLQGRLASRLDDLEDTIRNDWTKNRFIWILLISLTIGAIQESHRPPPWST